MKVLWLSHFLPFPPKGGSLQRSYNLVRELAKTNLLHILSFNQKALLPGESEIKKAAIELSKYCKHVQVVQLPADSALWRKKLLLSKSIATRKPYTVNWNISQEMRELVQRTVREFQPDLIHYDTIGMAEYWSTSLPCQQTLNHHNVESAMMLRRCRKEKNPVKKLYFLQEAIKLNRYERQHCRQFDCNLTVSAEDADLLRNIDSDLKIAVIPNGVDTNYFNSTGARKKPNSIVFAGGMGWYPNRDAMLYFADSVWPLLKKEISDLNMTVIGRSPPGKLVNLANTDPAFRVLGFVDDVRPYLEESMICVCPIRDGGGTRLKILDALSMALPIVATDIAVEGLGLVPDEHVLIANRPEEFVDKITLLFNDRKIAERLSYQGRKFVQDNYEWSLIGRKLRDLYANLAARQ